MRSDGPSSNDDMRSGDSRQRKRGGAFLAVNRISLRIGGEAGYGIMQAGLMFSKCCSRIGLHVFDYTEYPSLIRGGHNTYQVRAEEGPVNSHLRTVDVLIALDEPTLTLHADELKDDSLIIYDEKAIHPEHSRLKRGIRCPMPLKELVAEVGGPEIMQNTLALAAALGIVDYPFAVFEGIIRDSFGEKKQEVADQNVAVARKGYDYAKERYGHHSHYRLTPVADAPKRMVITGNEALALGAVKGGLKFYAAYPMTPSSSILHTLAAWQERHGIVVKQGEDEIGVVNMAMGAGYAGVRSMCATSGGGFALMNETYAMAGIAEIPIVICEVQRPGPASGMPTWTDQGDLQYVLHAGHGEFPRIVLAPGDVEECFWLAVEALNTAEQFQTPVIIISDKYLAESHRTMDPPDVSKVRIERGRIVREEPQHYLRYENTADGISPRTLPGVPAGFHLCNSYEHDEFGWTTEEAALRNRQVEKRARKLESYRKEQLQPALVGPEQAAVTIVSWGSTKGPVRDAMAWLAKDGYAAEHLHLTHLSPFPSATVTKLLEGKRTLLVENNSLGQLGILIRAETGIVLQERLLRYDGRPIEPEQVYDKVRAMLGGSR